MARTDDLNHAAPPKLLESLVEKLLPGAYRQQVAGDLHERFRSLPSYIRDAASAVPAAIFSQICRTTPGLFLLLEAVIVYTSFFGAYVWHDLSGRSPDFFQVAAITGVVMLGLLLRDAYGAQPIRSDLKPSFWLRLKAGLDLFVTVYSTVFFSCGVVWICQLVRPNLLSQFMHMKPTMTGIITSSILLSIVRIWIAILAKDRLRRAG